jgi:hypothetical protein
MADTSELLKGLQALKDQLQRQIEAVTVAITAISGSESTLTLSEPVRKTRKRHAKNGMHQYEAVLRFLKKQPAEVGLEDFYKAATEAGVIVKSENAMRTTLNKLVRAKQAVAVGKRGHRKYWSA